MVEGTIVGFSDGTNGFKLDGENTGDWLAAIHSGMGDINGDGINDFCEP